MVLRAGSAICAVVLAVFTPAIRDVSLPPGNCMTVGSGGASVDTSTGVQEVRVPHVQIENWSCS